MALLTNPLPAELPRLPLLAAQLKLLLPAVLLENPLRLPLPVALPKLLLPAVQLTSRKKSLLMLLPPVAPVTSDHGFPPKSVPGGKVLAGNLANHSVIPIYIHIPEDKVMMI